MQYTFINMFFFKYFGMMSISIFDIFEIEKSTIVQEVYKNIKWLSAYFHYPLIVIYRSMNGARVAQWVRSLDLTAHTSISPIRRGFAPSFVNYKKGALDSQPQVIKFTNCLPRVGGSPRVLRLPLPLKLVVMI